MEARVDAQGRIVVPKPLRDALGITADTVVDVSRYGNSLRVVISGRTARLVKLDDGGSVAESDTVVTDQMVFDLLDAFRR